MLLSGNMQGSCTKKNDQSTEVAQISYHVLWNDTLGTFSMPFGSIQIKCTNRYVVFALTYRNPTNNRKDWRPPSLYTVNQIIHLTFKEHIKILWPGNARYEVIILRIYRPTFQTNTSSLRPDSFTTHKRKKNRSLQSIDCNPGSHIQVLVCGKSLGTTYDQISR